MNKKPEFKGQEYKSLFFPAGLLLTLIFSYAAIEHKTYVKSYDEIVTTMLEDDTEDIIITKINPPKPPPPPPPPPVEIVVVEDTVEDIEETIFESTETDQEEIVEVEDIEIEEEWEDVDIPFAVVEQKPSFPGSTPARFQQDINNHIRRYFQYPPAAQELGIQGRVYISFIILKDGSIKIKGYRGPDRNLEREALRILSKLPIMEPGKQRNQPVNVPFSLPITFRIQ